MTDPQRAHAASLWMFAFPLVLVLVASCAPGRAPPITSPAERVVVSLVPSPSKALRPAPACFETNKQPLAWTRGSALARTVLATPPALGQLVQPLGEGARTATPLRFFGAHLFDLLDKIDREGGPRELDRRRLICAALDAVAAAGAPVLRLWGSLKYTGSAAEPTRAAELLELVVDENARRQRPLRFIVTLLNHQPGYGSPAPDRSLDDQDPESPWSARRIYLEEGWRAKGSGLLAARMEAFASRSALLGSPDILAWELVNELDTHRVIARREDAEVFRETFVIPALTRLAELVPQPILLGDLRAPASSYDDLARAILVRLSPALRQRLVWTSHVYAPKAASDHASVLANATWKLDRDLALASAFGLPFVLGELGQHIEGSRTAFCADGAPHDLGPLLQGVLDPGESPPLRRGISMALFWGEGQCDLVVPSDQGSRRVTLGAGGDSADLGPGDHTAREQVQAARRLRRFLIE